MTLLRSVPDWENREMPEKKPKHIKEEILDFIQDIPKEKFKDFKVKYGSLEFGFNELGISKKVKNGKVFVEIEIFDSEQDERK